MIGERVEMKKMIQCEICGGGHGVLIHHGTRDNDKIDVYECQDCKTKFLPAAEYNPDYENGFMHEKDGLSSYDIRENLKDLEKDDLRRYHMVKELCTHKKVMDFGCGFGGFLAYIQEVADECIGIELGADERKYLSSNGIRCAKKIEECSEQFDVITLFHVFEHLSNPREWLVKFSKCLSEEGLLIIEVPNAKDALLSLYESDSFADFTYWSAHLFLYTSESLRQLVDSTNCFKQVSSTQIQRYSIANHFYWLAKKLPGGHEKWKQLDSEDLNQAYEDKLRELGICDTIFMVFRKG